MQLADTIFVVVIVVFSAVIHEVMHGVAANKLGDPTARLMGRLTLNPFKHLDLFGSVILPLLLALSSSPVLFGWAKPVPYNPYNLRPGRWSEPIVAGAGPLSNLVIALIGSLAIRSGMFSLAMNDVLFLIVLVNIMLAVFNSIPIPPLDGSKMIEAFLPRAAASRYAQWRMRMEMNPFIGMGIILLIVLFLGGSFGNLIYGVANALAGV